MGQVLQSGATFVTKWGYYHKSSAVQKATETNRGGQKILVTYSSYINPSYLATDTLPFSAEPRLYLGIPFTRVTVNFDW